MATLARQMYPGKGKFIVEAYKDATKEPHGYLPIDLRPETDENYRIRTKIFPDDERQYVYISRRSYGSFTGCPSDNAFISRLLSWPTVP